MTPDKPLSSTMSHAHDPPAQPEAESPDGTPQVVVRAGKTYICSACGTLVEIPAEFVEQFVLVPPQRQQNKRPAAASPTAQDTPKQPPAPTSSDAAAGRGEVSDGMASCGASGRRATSTTAASSGAQPTRPTHPKRPPRPSFAGQLIDGLRVPQPKQLDRAFAWVTHHLTVLDRKDSELQQLAKLLKQQKKNQVPCPRPRRPVIKITTPPKSEGKDHPGRSQAHEDVSITPQKIDPGGKQRRERAPPSTEHKPPTREREPTTREHEPPPHE